MRRYRRGLTLAELVVAMVITVVIGLAVTGVAGAMSNINARAEDYYEYLQSGRVAASRLEEALRSAKLITVASGSSIVAWTSNETDKTKINVSEVTKVYLDTNTRQLMQRTTVFPDSLEPSTKTALDTSVTLADMVTANAANDAPPYAQYDVTRVLARNVQEFQVYPDVPTPLTQTVKFRLVVGSYAQPVTQYGAVTLRASKVSSVAVADGTYVLN